MNEKVLRSFPEDSRYCVKCDNATMEWGELVVMPHRLCRGGWKKKYWLWGGLVPECYFGRQGEHLHWYCQWCDGEYCTKTKEKSRG